MKNRNLAFVLVASLTALGSAGCYPVAQYGGDPYQGGQYQAPPPQLAPPAYYPPPPPPPFAFDRDPDEVWLIPDYDVYYVPTIDVDVFFFGDRWYRRSGVNWFFSLDLHGPWGWTRVDDVPTPVLRVPPDYRRQPARYQRVPFGIWKRQGYRWGSQPPAATPLPPPAPIPRPAPPPPPAPPRTPWTMDHDPDEVWLIPGSGVFFVPRLEVDLFFSGGSWFMRSSSGGDWYRGGNPRGPWSQTTERQVPDAIRRLPADFRTPQRYQRVPYGQWRDRGYSWPEENRLEPPRQVQPLPAPTPPPPKEPGPRPNPPGSGRNDQHDSGRSGITPPPPPPPVRELGPRMDRDPQEVLLVRKTRIFMVKAEEGDVFFLDGRWYGRRSGTWFSGAGARGPWTALPPNQAPGELRGLPENMKTLRIPFTEWVRKGYRWEEPADEEKAVPSGQQKGTKGR